MAAGRGSSSRSKRDADRLAAPERHRHAEAGDGVDLGQCRRQLVAVALGHAAGDDEPGAVPAELGQGEDRLDRLLPGRLDERAGVDDDQVGQRRVVDRHHPVSQQGARQLVAVDLVLRAAQRLHEERPGHEGSEARAPSAETGDEVDHRAG